MAIVRIVALLPDATASCWPNLLAIGFEEDKVKEGFPILKKKIELFLFSLFLLSLSLFLFSRSLFLSLLSN